MEVTRDEIIAICKEHIIPMWKEQPDTFPDFWEKEDSPFTRISAGKKQANEKLLEELMRRMKRAFTENPQGEQEENIWRQKVEQILADFLEREQILQIDRYMDAKTFQSFEQEMKRFIRQIREFDSELSMEQIWQAMRNYLIFSMIVELQGEKQQAGRPILGYSLLYPYTDNYIDDGRLPIEDKAHYNQLIADKLRGIEVQPHGELEEKTCQLLDEIADCYEGESLEQIRCVLLSLLEAQHRSIHQQRQGSKLPATEQILQISVYKGGTSVLADYFFSTEDWNREEAEFYLKFGLLLQLVDDLQDMDEDAREGSHTLMTEAKKEGRLEGCVNQLLWFSHKVIHDATPRSERLKPFVLRHCVGVTMITVGMKQDYFTKEYVKAIEPYLPFSVEFFRKLHRKQEGKELSGAALTDNQMRLIDLLIEE